MRIKKFLAVAFICTAFFAVGQAFADDADDGIDIDEVWINNVPPTSYWGLRGLPQTVAAEPLGMGRLNFLLSGSWYEQDQDLRGAFDTDKAGPGKGANVSTFRVGGSYGVSDDIDIFASVPMYVIGGADGDGTNYIGAGEFVGGGQFTFPFPPEMAFRLAFHGHVVYGFRRYNHEDKATHNPAFEVNGEFRGIDMNMGYAGYEFGEVREDGRITLVLKAPMSLVAGNLRRSAKLHINPGFALTQFADYPLFLLNAGVECNPAEYLTIGLEGNWRTPVSKGNGFNDPLWVTPTVMYRSSYYADGLFGWSFIAGADIRLSGETEYGTGKFVNNKEETVKTYPLESYRIFGGMVFSFDLLASKRAEMIRKARASAAEKARLRKLAALTEAQRDSVARKAHEDSLAQAAALAAKAEKARQDSIAMAEGSAEREAQLRAEAEAREAQLTAQSAATEAQLRAEADKKRVADSIALAELNKKLAEERAKRSAAEQQMLSTGMLVLDGVFFVTGKAEIQPNSRGYLTTLAKMLVKYPKLRIEIGGHTDNTGRLETNMALSQSRADAVFMFMHNIEPGLAQMLTSKGYGPTVPKADNNTAAGREANRRVEIKILNPEVLKEYNP